MLTCTRSHKTDKGKHITLSTLYCHCVGFMGEELNLKYPLLLK